MAWPEDMPLKGLRRLVVERLKKNGEPLRWSITDIEPGLNSGALPQLQIEAVMIVSES